MSYMIAMSEFVTVSTFTRMFIFKLFYPSISDTICNQMLEKQMNLLGKQY